MSEPNYAALIAYLDELGIDANHVMQEGADETGYNYRLTYSDGRSVLDSSSGTIQQKYDRRQWPDATVWPKVKVLLEGGSLSDIDKRITKPKATKASD